MKYVVGRHKLMGGSGNSNGGGGGSSALLSLLPGGPTTAQIANPAGLTDARGNAITCTRAAPKFCRRGTTFDTSNQVGTNLSNWGGVNSAVTATAAVAPDGTTSASLITDNSAVGSHGSTTFAYASTFDSTTTWVASAFLKAGTCNFAGLVYGNTGQGISWNLTTGAVVANTTPSSTGSATDMGNGWWRVTMTGTTTIAGENFYVIMNPTGGSNANPSYSGTGSTIYLYGPKAENGAVSTAFIAPPLYQLGNNIPVVEPEGLLCEGQGINLSKWSQTLDNAAWVATGATVTANLGVAPDGNVTADRVQLIAAARNSSQLSQNYVGTFSATTNTVSAWVRTTSGTATFSLRISYTGVADYFSGDFTATTQWQRFSFTQLFPTNASVTASSGITVGSALGAVDVHAWQMQFEQAPRATSEIVTVGGTATRAPDNISAALSGALTGARGSITATITPTWTGAGVGGSNFITTATVNYLYQPGDTKPDSSATGWSSFGSGSGTFAANTAKAYVLAWAANASLGQVGGAQNTTANSGATADQTSLIFGPGAYTGLQDSFWIHSILVARR